MARNKRKKAVIKDVKVQKPKRPELVVVNGVVTTKELAMDLLDSYSK